MVPVLCAHCAAPLEPHTASTLRCTVCVRFDGLRANASRSRRDGSAPGLLFDRREFAVWFAQQPRRCVYCGIPEELIAHLRVSTQVGFPLQRLGVDRLDGGAYRLDGIALCCFACNKARSNTFTSAEMVVLGAAVAQVWAARLAEVGVVWAPPGPAGTAT